MAASDLIGVDRDAVTLTLAAETPHIFKSYSIKCSVFDQPGTFALRLGWGETARELLQKYPPNTPFELRIGEQTLMTGRIDDPKIPKGDVTELELAGRDNMAALANAYFESEQSFRELSYSDLTRKSLDRVGLSAAALSYDNAANRKAITGTKKITVRREPRPADEVASQEIEQVTATTTKTVYNTIKAQLGETELAFLQRQYKRIGLFLWCDGYGGFVLSDPNAHQDPLYRLMRRRGQPQNVTAFPVVTTIEDCRFENRTKLRHSKAIVYGRAGGGKHGRTKVRGEFVDQEMVKWGFVKPVVVHDSDIKSAKEAEYAARRRIAEERRKNRILEYTVSGHTAPMITRPDKHIVWCVDTIVELDDQELGLSGPHYIAAAEYKRAPTTTTLTLLRPEDLTFAEEMAA